MKTYKPINGSYVLSCILNNFDIGVVDTHFGYSRFNISSNKPILVIVDDERFFTKEQELQKLVKPNTFFLFKTKSQQSKSKIENSFVFEYLDILEDCFALNYTNFSPYKSNNPFNFICLNGKYTDTRKILVSELVKSGLAGKNFVSFSDYKKIKNVYRPDLSSYYKQPPDRVYSRIGNIPCTTNFKNFLHISKKLPSKIVLMAETFQDVFYPCEKTFCAFFTNRVPITISSPDSNKKLSSEGFDLFEDIVNYDYDDIKGKKKRVKQCIIDNYNILSNGIKTDRSIIERTESNFNHLKNKWFLSKLKQLEKEVQIYSNGKTCKL